MSWFRTTMLSVCLTMVLTACGNSTGPGPTPRVQMGGATQGTPLSLSPAVSTFVGSSTNGSADGTGSAASFWNPQGITTDGTSLYVADSNNNTVRRVVIATGVVSTLAGSPGLSGSTDGTGATARFSSPFGITTDGTNLYVTDSGNHTIRMIAIATGVVTTIAGSSGISGTADGTGAAAKFNAPQGITTDGTNLYVADSGNHTIRMVTIATGVATTVAGTPGISGSADGTGTAASFFNPQGITTDGKNLFVVDSGNDTIRMVAIATAVVTTLAGSAGNPGIVDGTGSFARFTSPHGVTTDGRNLYVTDDASTIRKVVIVTGVVTTIAGRPGFFGSTDGTGDFVSSSTGVPVLTYGTARFWFPQGITTDGRSLFVADSVNNMIRKIY